MLKKSFFISLEGGEGCGKSTQLTLLATSLRARFPGREILETRSPGGTPVAERLRDVLKNRANGEKPAPETELLLFAACHAQMVRALIRPALERGAIVLTDRFCDSTLVYQGCARGLDIPFIRTINRFACGELHPDKTILLDVDPETALARTRLRTGETPAEQDWFDSETLAFHRAIRKGFLDLAASEPERFAVVDASRPTEKVHHAILEALHDTMG